MKSGKFIVFEGGEGAGKDTQIDLLRESLKNEKILFTREPGGTTFGKQLRSILLESDHKIVPEAEALLFLADRAQHMAELIEPTLAAGTHVISNRSYYSLVAYQIYGRDRHDLRPLVDLAHQIIYKNKKPDLVIFLDIPAEVGLKRAELRGTMNRIDKAPIEMHQRVRQGFLDQLDGRPEVLKIDGTGSVEEIQQVILERIRQTTMV